jgi:hypothetical protein
VGHGFGNMRGGHQFSQLLIFFRARITDRKTLGAGFYFFTIAILAIEDKYRKAFEDGSWRFRGRATCSSLSQRFKFFILLFQKNLKQNPGGSQ